MSLSKQGKSKKKAGTKYRHPIPSRIELLDFIKDSSRPVVLEDIAGAFAIAGSKRRRKLLEELAKMVRAGQILENRRGEFLLLKRLDFVTGTVIGHQDGFGFLRRDEGGDDVYLSAGQMRSLFNGDRAVIKIVGEDRRGRPEGRLVEVLERGVTEIAGQFIRERGVGIV
ncbi:MAG: ribonuclease R, partial [Gammaproteobacteria bacterium]|nr:ribonuclease R [Gammaproteobacteria bacterium]